ncbi:sensor histidine kinase [Nakamurella flava]|uniref:sensor histidine kinase n=1 Tax=Nakamurella flava TaxID=2576308 RepID=UPI00140D7D5D|nr:sensor histidine kinase [Nakamurella flava]
MARLPFRSGSSWSLARRILVLQAVVLVGLVAVALALLLWDANQEAERATGDRVTAIAETVAADPTVRQQIQDRTAGTAGPSGVLEPYAEQVRANTGTDFVVIMWPDGTRLTHPDRNQIGKQYLGTRDAALAGGIGVETYVGTLGPSVRAIVPITAADGQVQGMVAVGVTVERVDSLTARRLWLLAAFAAGAIIVGVIGSVLIARWVRRQTLGLGPRELARTFTYYDAVLASVHEGMLMLDRNGRIVSVNAQAQRLLGLDRSAIGRTPTEAGLPSHITAIVEADAGSTSGAEELGGTTTSDELALLDDRTLVISRRPVRVNGRPAGAVVSMRDHTELTELSGELDRVSSFSEALRAQAHESANRLHTVVSLIELGETEHAVEFALEELEMAQALADRVLDGGGNRAVEALLLAKSAQAAERGIELVVRTRVLPADLAPDQDLVTIMGNLLDNAMDVLAGQPAGQDRRIEVAASGVDDPAAGYRITVSDTGPGMSAGQAAAVFRRGWSTKQARGPAGARGLGLALVAQAVRRCGGTVVAHPGPGAVFDVWLPYDRATADPNTVPGSAGSDQPVGGHR